MVALKKRNPDTASSDSSFIRGRSHMWVPPKELVDSVVPQFSTPTFLYDRDTLRQNFFRIKERLGPDLDIFYSLKANPNASVANQVCSLAAGAEVSSLAELRTALRIGVEPESIIFVGPGKSTAELQACIENRIYAIVCESIDELHDVDSITRLYGEPSRKTRVMIRVNPEFSSQGAGLSMSGRPRQFGIDEARVRSSAEALKQLCAIEVLGFHIYMGTRYLEAQQVVSNTENILRLASSLAQALRIPLRAVDIGGGLGVPYFDGETAIDLLALGAGINESLSRFRQAHPDTRVIMELGRILVAGCGVLLTRVRYVKESMGETFAITDGGTNLHMAAVGLGSFVKRNFPVVSFSHSQSEQESYTVTGPLCTPNDTLARRVQLNKLKRGDILGVLLSGAYGPTASPVQFLSHGYPAEVLAIGGDAYLVRKRDTVEDILQHQRLVWC